jgi:stage IV sporulation protein A
MEKVLLEFPIREIGINMPQWVEALDDNHWLKSGMLNSVKDTFKNVRKIYE